MGEPARKLDPELPPAAPRPQQRRRARLRALPPRREAPRPEDAWVLDQILSWYRTRRD
jgi:hypothetical protein